jgi:hypothetical protein
MKHRLWNCDTQRSFFKFWDVLYPIVLLSLSNLLMSFILFLSETEKVLERINDIGMIGLVSKAVFSYFWGSIKAEFQ